MKLPINLTLEDRGKAIAEAFLGETGRIVELRAAGVAGALTEERRAALLAAAVAREAVEIELDILAYEQQPGVRNMNCFRFRDGALMSLGSSGVGTPFLRDHDRWSVDAIGGEVIASKTTKRGEGDYEIRQTVKVTEPAAVERALRGNLKAVSIGAMPTGPVLCSLCNTPVFEDCWHYRGQEVDNEDGTTDTCEWIYTSAVLVETSEVPIGAVPRAGVQTIRAALAAAGSNGKSSSSGRITPPQEKTMKNRAAIVAKLKLVGLLAACANPAEPTDDEIAAGIDQLVGDRAELAIAQRELQASTVSAADTFIRDALASGRITPADEATWRDFFGASPERARARMAQRPANVATPVGAQAQRTKPEPTEAEVKNAVTAAAAGTGAAAVEDAETKAKAIVEANGIDYQKALKWAKAFGAKSPKADIARFCAGVGEV